MAVTPTYPGVYITETPSIPHVITPATTNLTAILGDFPQGPVDEAVLVSSWAQFASVYGKLTTKSSLAAYAAYQFFLNEVIGAWIVRLTVPGSEVATAELEIPAVGAGASPGSLSISALGPGVWANELVVGLAPVKSAADPNGTHAAFTVSPPKPASGNAPPPLETIANIALLEPDGTTPVSAVQLAAVISSQSNYVSAALPGQGAPAATGSQASLAGGNDGQWPSDEPTYAADFLTAVENALAQGAPLDSIAPAVFNIMCIPDAAVLDAKTQASVFAAAHTYCVEREAFLLVDPPGPKVVYPTPAITVDSVGIPQQPAPAPPAGLTTLTSTWASLLLGVDNVAAATYYPWVQITDPVTGLSRFVPPSGTVAGVYAATDSSRGVWKAPAGVEAAMPGVTGLADTTLNDTVNGELNVMGINCLRTFPLYGSIVWGSRTLAGSDVAGSAFKYVPVRRLTDFIEQSLQQSLRWAVFEPNGPALWSSISIEVTTFMAGLFGAGAFAGTSAATAYSVVCDATTTSPTDQLSGIVNVNVGFAPIDPAEFVMLNIQINAAAAAS
jgi:Bacteriophage tail sheath protein